MTPEEHQHFKWLYRIGVPLQFRRPKGNWNTLPPRSSKSTSILDKPYTLIAFQDISYRIKPQ